MTLIEKNAREFFKKNFEKFVWKSVERLKPGIDIAMIFDFF